MAGSRNIITIGAIVLVVIFMIVSVKSSLGGSQSTQAKYHDGKVSISGIEWYTNVDEALQVARMEKKPVFVFFHAEWCKYCARFKSEVYPNPEVKSYLTGNFVPVAIDIDRDPTTSGRFQVAYPPQEVVLSPDGREIARLPGFPSRSPVESFLAFLRDARMKM